MKTKSLRKLLNSYGSTNMMCSALCFGISIPVYDWLCTKMHHVAAFGISLMLFATVLCIMISSLNKVLIRAYNEKLSKDAYELASQLKGNKNVDTDVLKELLTEVRNK